MTREAKITIICPVDIDDIDDEVDVTNETELYDALKKAVRKDLFTTEYLAHWDKLEIEDMGECED